MSKKIITVLGGNGYIGSRCVDYLVKRRDNYKIYMVCRSGKVKYDQNKINENVKIISGDCLNPEGFKDIIEESSGIIHAIGVLFTNNNQAYYNVNKETCLRVARFADETHNNKEKVNFVYVSASRGIPFPLSLKYHGYIESKRETEKELLNSFNNLNPVILRPGFVKSDIKKWTYPIYYSVGAVELVEKKILNKIIPDIGEKLQLPSKGIELDTLVKYACEGALGNLEPKKIYTNDIMNNNI